MTYLGLCERNLKEDRANMGKITITKSTLLFEENKI
jgi:hypothetical protein